MQLYPAKTAAYFYCFVPWVATDSSMITVSSCGAHQTLVSPLRGIITVFHGDYTGPNVCHHEMGFMVTQDFTASKVPILA